MIETIPIKIGKSKLTAFIIDEYPAAHGNNFTLVGSDGKYYFVENFYLENLKEWIRRSGQTDLVVERVLKAPNKIMIRICDERIPREWYPHMVLI